MNNGMIVPLCLTPLFMWTIPFIILTSVDMCWSVKSCLDVWRWLLIYYNLERLLLLLIYMSDTMCALLLLFIRVSYQVKEAITRWILTNAYEQCTIINITQHCLRSFQKSSLSNLLYTISISLATIQLKSWSYTNSVPMS